MNPEHTKFEAQVDRAIGEERSVETGQPTAAELAAAALHNSLAPSEPMPADVKRRMLALADNLSMNAARPVEANRMRLVPWIAAAAGIVLAGLAVAYGVHSVQRRDRELVDARSQLAAMHVQIESNGRLLADARERAEVLASRAAQAEAQNSEQAVALAEAARRQTELAEQLAAAASRLREGQAALALLENREREVSRELNETRLTLARLQEPVDPATLAQNRTKLLEVPDTIRVAWAPFDLPDAPAEQRTVQGDVIWNDRLQTGYLRFVGLKVNDPKTEQYQVWVIDERGLEQKVSGGVFNATADGEVIVPIDPGIPVGRVALFAVTVEKPGGTWVPDLKRRVVVAPRS
jgi:hypothetical protein